MQWLTAAAFGVARKAGEDLHATRRGAPKAPAAAAQQKARAAAKHRMMLQGLVGVKVVRQQQQQSRGLLEVQAAGDGLHRTGGEPRSVGSRMCCLRLALQGIERCCSRHASVDTLDREAADLRRGLAVRVGCGGLGCRLWSVSGATVTRRWWVLLELCL